MQQVDLYETGALTWVEEKEKENPRSDVKGRLNEIWEGRWFRWEEWVLKAAEKLI